jgi:excisionase family DNA binding protein
MDPLMELGEAAVRLGVVKDKIYRLLGTGELPYHRGGRAVGFRWMDWANGPGWGQGL